MVATKTLTLGRHGVTLGGLVLGLLASPALTHAQGVRPAAGVDRLETQANELNVCWIGQLALQVVAMRKVASTRQVLKYPVTNCVILAVDPIEVL